VLLVSYDGVLAGPARSQVPPCLRAYGEAGWPARLLSFERPELLAEEGLRREVEGEIAGAGWTALPWRRSMVRDWVAGRRAVRRLVAEERPAVLHARSYVPALLCDLHGRAGGARLLFDMRGLWPDERVDGGLWSRRHPLHVLWKRLERRLLRRAGGVVVLAGAGARLLREEGLLPAATPVEVIPCGADLGRFRPLPAADLAPEARAWAGKRTYAFLGATGTWYRLDAMLDFAALAAAREEEARILFLTEDPGGTVAEGLAARGVPADRFLVRAVPHAEVPRWIGGARAGVFFIRDCRSKRASCPTKLAEFLACGVPVVTGTGVGDVEGILRETGTGVVAGGSSAAEFDGARAALDGLRADPGLGARCRRAAEERFDARACGAAFVRLAGRIRGA
jgi:glycosyltransferase involved in cell wall biosynthesis